jgi:hypothetical protein
VLNGLCKFIVLCVGLLSYVYGEAQPMPIYMLSSPFSHSNTLYLHSSVAISDANVVIPKLEKN